MPHTLATAAQAMALPASAGWMALLALLAVAAIGYAAWRNQRARAAAQRLLAEAQRETARREQEFSLLIQGVQELIFRTDAQGNIRFANPRWQAMTDQSPETARGKHLSDIVLPECRSTIQALFAPQQPEGLRSAQAQVRDQGGSLHVLEFSVTPLRNRDGQLRGFVGSGVDITELHMAQQRQKEHLEFTERVLEFNPLPMHLTDVQGRFITVNKAWENFMGLPRSQVLGRTCTDLLPRAQAQSCTATSAQLLHEGGTVRYEERLQLADGSPRDVQVTKVLLRSSQGHPIGILITQLDITDYLGARDLAQQASRTKSEFVANISHELRTPLQSILGFSELGMARGRQHEKLAAMFGDIHAAGLRMLGLVNDLLDISKIESTVGAFHFERNDVRDIIEDVAAELEMLLQQRKLQLALNLGRMPLVAKVDTARFSQVVRNVLANAVKFAPEGSRIDVGAQVQGENTIHIQVRDRGPGIPAAELEKIFQAFVQSSQTRDGSGGTGLGLAICRKIMTAHGGRIHATNAPGEGAIFHITVPTAGYTDTMPAPLL